MTYENKYAVHEWISEVILDRPEYYTYWKKLHRYMILITEQNQGWLYDENKWYY